VLATEGGGSGWGRGERGYETRAGRVSGYTRNWERERWGGRFLAWFFCLSFEKKTFWKREGGKTKVGVGGGAANKGCAGILKTQRRRELGRGGTRGADWPL